MCLSTLICCPWAYGSSLKQLYLQYLAQIFWFFQVTCGVKMTSLRHGWGWQLPQTSSYMYYRNIQHYVWAHCWYAVHGHMGGALNSYTHNTCLLSQIVGFWFWVTLESKWCHYVMVEANSQQLKLFIAYFIEIYKMFKHIDMLSKSMWH